MSGADFTIGMAAFDNFDEVYFTVQALRFYHVELMKRFEIVVVDNNPDSKDGQAIKSLIEGRVKDGGRYVPFPEPKGSVPPRGHLFDVAAGKWVICIDSHVLLAPGALQSLVDYFDANPKSDDLLHGPLLSNYGPHRVEATHMRPVWRSHMFGTWGVDERGKDPDGEAFEIPQHGLGLFAARRESWLRFNPEMKGFSGGEGYIHEKYRQAGRRVLCLPGARWYHKFSRPNGIPHKPTLEDKIRNHVRGWSELGVDLQTGKKDEPLRSMCEHYVTGVGARKGKPAMPYARFVQLCKEAGHEYKGGDPGVKLRGVVIGPTSWGSYRMRGRPLVAEYGFAEKNSRGKIELGAEKYDVCLAVKCGVPPVVRAAAKRVIWEPLDLWFSDRRAAQLSPKDWLSRMWKEYGFDELIVSTIPMKDAAERYLREVKIHFVPHHADPRIGLDWYDSAGPIVYAGMKDFLGQSGAAVIRQAGELIGREVVIDHAHHSWQRLKGASLVLAPRLSVRTQMNLLGKPTVKLANAAQAGIPVLATDDPAITSLFVDVRTARVEDWLDAKSLAPMLEAALGGSPSAVKFPADRWLARMKEIVG